MGGASFRDGADRDRGTPGWRSGAIATLDVEAGGERKGAGSMVLIMERR